MLQTLTFWKFRESYREIILSTLSIALAGALLIPIPLDAGGCGWEMYNFKDHRPLLPDNHGDTNVYGPEGEEWELDHYAYHSYFQHNDFEDHGYTRDEHSTGWCYDVPADPDG